MVAASWGNFADSGTVSLNVHRHLAAKNVLFIGNTYRPHDIYCAHFDMVIRHRKIFLWHKLVTHRFPLDQCGQALKKAYQDDALKVVFTP